MLQNRKKSLTLQLFALLLFVPAHAQGETIRTLIERVMDLVTLVLPIIAGLTLFFVLWGGVKHIAVSGDAKGREESRNALIWGVLILFVIVSVWGIVAIVSKTFF